MEETKYSELAYAQAQSKTQSPFYVPNIEHKIPDETHELLTNYSHIPPEEHSAHLHKIRDQAWSIRQYPCTGLGAWLVPQLRRLPVYSEILSRVKAGAAIADIGTFLGYDLRRLVYDGCPSSNMYAVDIVDHWSVSYACFRDQETFQAKFIIADLLSWQGIGKPIDIIVISQLLHQWGWEQQVDAAVQLTGHTEVDSIVVGNMIGNVTAQKVVNALAPTGFWRHNDESFAKMWQEVGSRTGTRWKTQTWPKSFPEMGWEEKDAAWMEDGTNVLEFCARRLS